MNLHISRSMQRNVDGHKREVVKMNGEYFVKNPDGTMVKVAKTSTGGIWGKSQFTVQQQDEPAGQREITMMPKEPEFDDKGNPVLKEDTEPNTAEANTTAPNEVKPNPKGEPARGTTNVTSNNLSEKAAWLDRNDFEGLDFQRHGAKPHYGFLKINGEGVLLDKSKDGSYSLIRFKTENGEFRGQTSEDIIFKSLDELKAALKDSKYNFRRDVGLEDIYELLL